MTVYPYKARERVEALIRALETFQERDPSLDAIVEAIKADIGRETR